MQQELATRYPLVLVPGMLGFVRVLLYPYWFGIVPALRKGGAQVFPVQVSPVHSNEVRGEQLLAIIEDICQRTGAAKVNLIGHSQGRSTHAMPRPSGRIGSPRSLRWRGPTMARNWPITLSARRLGIHPRGVCSRPSCMAWRCCWYGWKPAGGATRCRSTCMLRIRPDQRRRGAVQPGLSTGAAGNLGWEGAHQVNGVRYYSWSGTLQPGLTDQGRNRFDGSSYFCRLFARSFVRKRVIATAWSGASARTWGR